MSLRPGAASVAELLMVSWLFALVLAGVARYAGGQGRLVAAQRDQVRVEEAIRTTGVILSAELRHLTMADLGGGTSDSVRIRAFRGGGPVCHREGQTLTVAYAGIRPPDPLRDSVLLIGPTWEAAYPLVEAEPAEDCPGVALRLDEPPATRASFALVFETGAYSVSGGALRYRRGAGGRQPLTETILRDAAISRPPAGFSLVLAADPDSLQVLRPSARLVHIQALNRGTDP